MFKSLTSFIFGANNSVNDTQERIKTDDADDEEKKQAQLQAKQQGAEPKEAANLVDGENTIEVASCTPSIAPAGSRVTSSNNRAKGRGRNRRNNAQNNHKRNLAQDEEKKQKKALPSITKLLTPSDDFKEELDEDNADDDWIILEKEDEADSLPRSDSEEELSVVEVKQPLKQQAAVDAVAAAAAASTNAVAPAALRRRLNVGSKSLYSGPRPQQQRNYLQRTRTGRLRSLSTSSPPRSAATILGDGNREPDAAVASPPAADVIPWGGMTQSLYVAAPSGREGGSPIAMEESWFVTPPPCFTSIGPIHMETSPYENLLIEHPSMSVYYSIRSAQEASKSLVNLDLGVKEAQQPRKQQMTKKLKLKPMSRKATKAQEEEGDEDKDKTSAVAQRRPSAARVDRFSAAQLKQELLARSNQKSHVIEERRQAACRGAIDRSNRTRDYQSKGKPQRRADMQHFRLVSGANNNRKCCF